MIAEKGAEFILEDAYRDELVRLVPGAGLEPARCLHPRILSPLRLPISSPGAQGWIVHGL